MTIIVAVEKDGKFCMASDTLKCGGDTVIPNEESKIISSNGNYIGIAGWWCLNMMVTSILEDSPITVELKDRASIYNWSLNLLEILKEKHYMDVTEERDKPTDSLNSEILLCNKYGIFKVDQFRSVVKIDKFYATGSGMEYALGAMNSCYEGDRLIAAGVARAGIQAACAFDPYCGYEEPMKYVEGESE